MSEIDDIVARLKLAAHPEGGYFRRTYRHAKGPVTAKGEERGHMSSILYLQLTDYSLWHATDGDELWYWHAGAPLTLETREGESAAKSRALGPDFMAGESPQLLVPGGVWQRAKSQGDWTLVSCAVSPGFVFETYQLERPDQS